MNTITIDGKEYSVKFDMSTLIAFEQTIGKSFFETKFTKIYDRIILIFSAMFSANEDVTIDILTKSQDWAGITQAFKKVEQMAFNDFFKIPEVLEKDKPQPEDDQEKNA